MTAIARRTTPPPAACDTHFHIFSPLKGPRPDAKFVPPAAPRSALEAMHRTLGIERGVLIQTAVAGIDYDELIDDLAWGRGRLRGVALIGDHTSDTQLDRLVAAGVRGCRVSFVDFLGYRPDLHVFDRTVDRAAELGWHVVLHLEGKDLIELAPRLRSLRTPYVVDHVSHLRPGDGLHQAALEILRELQRDDRCWVKLSSTDRWSTVGPPTYDDAVPLWRAVIAAAPERVVWATDWPHVMYKDPRRPGDPPPDDSDLLDLLRRAVLDESSWRKVLVENPARLYGFPAA